MHVIDVWRWRGPSQWDVGNVERLVEKRGGRMCWGGR